MDILGPITLVIGVLIALVAFGSGFFKSGKKIDSRRQREIRNQKKAWGNVSRVDYFSRTQQPSTEAEKPKHRTLRDIANR